MDPIKIQHFPSVSQFEYTTFSHITVTEVVVTGDVIIDPVSKTIRQVVQLITYVFFCGIISMFGIGANIANIIVFVKQGFKDSINISLFGLAIADLGCLVTMFYSSFGYNPLFETLNLPFEIQAVTYITGLAIADLGCLVTMFYSSFGYNPLFETLNLPFEIQAVTYITGGYPHVYFNRITSFITVFITMERCLCIAMPLKVKNIITHFRTKVINISVFCIMVIIFSPFYFVNKLEWKYDLTRNTTVLGIAFTKHREIVESVTFLVHSVALSTILLISVTICTIILVVMLNRKTKWRKASVAKTKSQSETGAVKEKKVVKMVTMISTIFVICFIPASANFFMMTYDPEFSIRGKLQNLFFVTWSVAFVLEAVNSSVNIFVYFNMSTKFRVTFIEIFSRKNK